MKHFNFKNFKIFTEQGRLLNFDKLQFKRILFVSADLYRKLFLNPKRQQILKIRIYNLKNKFFFKYLKYQFSFYNGKLFVAMKPLRLQVLFRFGQFIATRIINTGRVLHQRKKAVKKKK
jgi:ribosomal protein S19